MKERSQCVQVGQQDHELWLSSRLHAWHSRAIGGLWTHLYAQLPMLWLSVLPERCSSNQRVQALHDQVQCLSRPFNCLTAALQATWHKIWHRFFNLTLTS
jgi:hypothetical protein